MTPQVPASELRQDFIRYVVENIEAYLKGFLLPLLGATPVGEVVEAPELTADTA